MCCLDWIWWIYWTRLTLSPFNPNVVLLVHKVNLFCSLAVVQQNFSSLSQRQPQSSITLTFGFNFYQASSRQWNSLKYVFWICVPEILEFTLRQLQGGASAGRKKTFKKGVDHEEARRGRTETSIQLRKGKKEDQIQKRRAVSVEKPLVSIFV